MAWHALQAGFITHRFHMRTCGGTERLCRTLYHAGAAIASNYLVTLYRSASRLFEDAGAPPEALVPLMTRTIENGFQLTGPIARGDWATVEAHKQAIRAERPELEDLYETLADATVLLA